MEAVMDAPAEDATHDGRTLVEWRQVEDDARRDNNWDVCCEALRAIGILKGEIKL